MKTRKLPCLWWTKELFLRVGICCRVSSVTVAQLHNLAAQASYLLRFSQHHKDWIVEDIYIETYNNILTRAAYEYGLAAFAVDSEDDKLWGIVNGSSMLPQTIVMDKNGTVIYNKKIQ